MKQEPASNAQWSRARRIGIRAALLIVSTVVSLELMLVAASLVRPDRRTAWHEDSSHRILCIGDSHTWGAGVEPEEAYPAQLQDLLNARMPGVYSVINIGLPGMNTAQLRNRIGNWLSRYDPDTLVVWAGVNDGWNSAEVGELAGGWRIWLDQQFIRSRLYRFFRVRIHDRALERYVTESPEESRWQIERPGNQLPSHNARFRVRHTGIVEDVIHEGGPRIVWAQLERRVAADLKVISRYARAADVELIFITYPSELGGFAAPNRAIRRTAKGQRAMLIDSAASRQRVPEANRVWLWAMHPGPKTYREIAHDVASVVLEGAERSGR